MRPRALATVLGALVAASCASHRAAAPAAQAPASPSTPGRGAVEAPSSGLAGLSGRFYLAARVHGVRQPDMIDFRPDGTCTAQVSGRVGLPGKWEVSGGGIFLQVEGAPESLLAGPARLSPYALHVAQADGSELIYAPRPRPPYVPQGAFMGTRTGSAKSGHAAQELSADGRFRSHNIELFGDEGFYLDIRSDGRFTYDEGVITYNLEHQENLVDFDYMRDFVVGLDDRCVWMVEVVIDELVCMTRASNLDLPAPPAGYRPFPR